MLWSWEFEMLCEIMPEVIFRPSGSSKIRGIAISCDRGQGCSHSTCKSCGALLYSEYYFQFAEIMGAIHA